MLGDKGPSFEGLTLMLLLGPFTTALHPGLFHHQRSLWSSCRARQVPAPVQQMRWRVTVGAALPQSWPATSLTRVLMALTRSTVVRAKAGTCTSTPAVEGTRHPRAGMAGRA